MELTSHALITYFMPTDHIILKTQLPTNYFLGTLVPTEPENKERNRASAQSASEKGIVLKKYNILK